MAPGNILEDFGKNKDSSSKAQEEHLEDLLCCYNSKSARRNELQEQPSGGSSDISVFRPCGPELSDSQVLSRENLNFIFVELKQKGEKPKEKKGRRNRCQKVDRCMSRSVAPNAIFLSWP